MASWREVIAEVVEDEAAFRGVGVGHVLEFHAGGACQPGFIARFFQWDFFYLHETFACRESVDEDGDEACQVAERALDLPDQLDEGYHHAVGDGALVEPCRAPKESDEIATHETGTEERGGHGGELGARPDLLAQVALHPVESFDHGRLLFEGLHDSLVLYGFLQDALDAAVSVTDFARELPHPFHVEFAQHDETGNDGDGQAGQRGIHGIEKKECPHEPDAYGHDGWCGFGDGIHYVAHIKFQPVEQVAAVAAVSCRPFAMEQAVEIVELHVVLCFDT